MQKYEKKILKNIGKTIFKYKMIEEGDKIVVAVSGGKDSLTLLYDLSIRAKSFPIKYLVKAVCIEPDFLELNKEALLPFFESLSIEYEVIKVGIIQRLKEGKHNNCYWCSNQRRMELVKYAVTNGYNKIALGHHINDIAETILMNMFYNKKISSMLPVMRYKKFPVTIIRPLAMLKEDEIEKFSILKSFPINVKKCVYGEDSKRLKIKHFMKEVFNNDRTILRNIINSIKNIDYDYL